MPLQSPIDFQQVVGCSRLYYPPSCNQKWRLLFQHPQLVSLFNQVIKDGTLCFLRVIKNIISLLFYKCKMSAAQRPMMFLLHFKTRARHHQGRLFPLSLSGEKHSAQLVNIVTHSVVRPVSPWNAPRGKKVIRLFVRSLLSAATVRVMQWLPHDVMQNHCRCIRICCLPHSTYTYGEESMHASNIYTPCVDAYTHCPRPLLWVTVYLYYIWGGMCVRSADKHCILSNLQHSQRFEIRHACEDSSWDSFDCHATIQLPERKGHMSDHMPHNNCHLGWQTLGSKCNTTNYDWLATWNRNQMRQDILVNTFTYAGCSWKASLLEFHEPKSFSTRHHMQENPQDRAGTWGALALATVHAAGGVYVNEELTGCRSFKETRISALYSLQNVHAHM